MATKRRASTRAKSARETYHHGDLAREILATSVELVREVGVEALSLREAARRVGVNHRAVYRHYADKRALLVAISAESHRQLATAMHAAIVETASPRDNLVAIAVAYLRYARTEPARYEVMFGPRLNEDGAYPELEAVILETTLPLRSQIRRFGSNTTPAQRRDAGVSLWASIHGLTHLVLTRRIPLSEARAASYVATIVGPTVDGIALALAGE